MSERTTRRRRLTRRAFLAAAALGVGTPAYAHANTKWPVVERMEITLPRLPAEADGLKIAALSDTHVGWYRDGESVRRAVRLANAEKPDIACFLGDYCHHLDGEPQRVFDDAILPFAELDAPLGSFAVPGNHDYWDGLEQVKRSFETAGIPLLFDENRTIDIPGGRLAIIGLDDLWDGDPVLADAFEGVPESLPRITLSHNPDVFVLERGWDFSLMLSGHTHGGQIVIPFYGALRLPIRSGRRYASGHIAEGDQQLYVTRGVGTVTPPVRLFCRPEVTLLTLRSPDRR